MENARGKSPGRGFPFRTRKSVVIRVYNIMIARYYVGLTLSLVHGTMTRVHALYIRYVLNELYAPFRHPTLTPRHFTRNVTGVFRTVHTRRSTFRFMLIVRPNKERK